MNRRFEDVKINIKSTPKKYNDVKVVEDIGNHNPTHVNMISDTVVSNDSSSKYNFLDKRSQKVNNNQRMYQTPVMPAKKRSVGSGIFTVFILSLLVGAFYLLSTTFLHANITVIAKNKTFDLKNQKFTAGKTGGDNVPFEIMAISGSEYKDIVLTSSKEVSEKAKGNITFYNEYSAKAQKIVAGTFISDEKGKTYKTDTTISIPGYTTDKDKKIIPGKISVSATAFLPGETYNGEPSDFYINSFKNSDKYKKIYGKAETPFTGGMTGLVYLLDESEKAGININVSSLKEKLLRKLNAQVPDGYLMYPETIAFSSVVDENIVSKTPDAKIEAKGTISAIILKQNELYSATINKLIPGISSKEKSEILPPGMSGLSFSFSNKDLVISKDTESFDFELTGPLALKWSPNNEELKTLLAGKRKDDVTVVFKQDPGILSASVKIVPFWSKVLPENTKNIKIILK